MNTQTVPRATLDDLMKTEGKAELINGRIVPLMPTGALPSRIAKRILYLLDPHVVAFRVGEVFTDNLGYALDPPLPSGRQSFSPDLSYYVGPLPPNLMKFIDNPPTFAVEVRSEHDYGPAKEREHAKRLLPRRNKCRLGCRSDQRNGRGLHLGQPARADRVPARKCGRCRTRGARLASQC